MASSTRRGVAVRRRWLVSLLASALLTALVVPAHGLHAQEAPASPQLPILLLNGAVYPNEYSAGDLPEAFRVSSYGDEVPALHMVQCAGHIRESWLEGLRGIGGEIRGYLPYNTLLVALDGNARSRLGELDFVLWKGLYQPYFKISPALQLRLSQGGEVVVLAGLYSQRILDETLEALGEIALVEVLGSEADASCAMVALRMPVASLGDVAALPAVEWVELCTYGTLPAVEWVELRTQGTFPAASVSSLRESGAGAAMQQAAGGGEEKVALGDTGLGTGGTLGLPLSLAGRVLHLVSLRGDDGADVGGHGTAVAGCILDAAVAGGAAGPVSRLAIIAYATGYGLECPPRPLSLYSVLEDACGRGARVFLSGSVPEGVESLGGYGLHAMQRDAFVWNNPTMMVVEAAGNEGTDSKGDGMVDAGSLLGGAAAKNVLSVGGCENPEVAEDEVAPPTYSMLEEAFSGRFPEPPLRDDYSAGSENGMAAFSSRGPTRDGRLKPDLVAPATAIPALAPGGPAVSPGLLPSAHAGYVQAYGTSMAAALVTRDVASMRLPLTSVQGIEPSAALLKAFLVNGAEDLHPGQYGEKREEVPPAPNAVQGWGRLNMDAFWRTGSWVKVVDDTEGMRLGESRAYRIEVTSGNELRVTLAWSDYPSLPQSRLHLVNDLDLRLIDAEGNAHYPNGRSSRDPLNNVERVVLDISAKPGDYTIELSAWNVPFSPQPFALVAQVL